MKKLWMGIVGLVALMAGPALGRRYARQGATAGTASGDLQLERLLHRRQWRLGAEPQLLGLRHGARSSHSQWLHDQSGGVIGGQIGYRWQANQFVFGLEAQGDWADISGIARQPDQSGLLNPRQGRQLRPVHRSARLGLGCGAVLCEGRRGGHRQSLRHPHHGVLRDIASASSTRWGGTLGVGFEYGFAPNWSLGAEYDHLFMGNRTTRSRSSIRLSRVR